MIITKEMLKDEINRLSKLSKAEIDTFLKSEEQEGFLHNGDVLSEDACNLLFFSDETISTFVKKALIKSLKSASGGITPPLEAELTCPCCGKSHPKIMITKTAITCRSLAKNMFIDRNETYNYRFSDECFDRYPNGLLCKECYNKTKSEVERDIKELLEKPIDELKELLLTEKCLSMDKSNHLLEGLLYYQIVKQNGKDRIVAIKSRDYSHPFDWEDEDYKKERAEREAIKQRLKEQRRKDREEAARKAHEEYVAKLDETGLPEGNLPSTPVSELFVIRELLKDYGGLNYSCSILTPEMFLNESWRKIYSVIKDNHDNGLLNIAENNQTQFFLINQLIEERYGKANMANLLLPLQLSDMNGVISKRDYDHHLYDVVKTYVERELYIVGQKIRHVVHEGCAVPFLLLQYANEKISILNKTAENCKELRAEYPEAPISRVFDFGKYKGREIKDIMEQQPSYITWLIENTSFSLTDEEKEYFKIIQK